MLAGIVEPERLLDKTISPAFMKSMWNRERIKSLVVAPLELWDTLGRKEEGILVVLVTCYLLYCALSV